LIQLNSEQRKAVEYLAGSVIVFAGPGSGKTRVIINRIAHLIRQGVSADKILTLTFTNKASSELLLRAHRLHPDARQSTIGTFHSVCASWLREFAYELDFTPNFSIYDDRDCMTILKNVAQEVNCLEISLLSSLKTKISMAKNYGLSPKSVQYGSQYIDFTDQQIDIYTRYQKFLKESQAMDFGDLLLQTYELLSKSSPVLKNLQERFHFIHVDEYQDTNKIQEELVFLLAGERQNIMVVGDDDQSIYGWRGASIDNIHSFEQRYPKVHKIVLSKNYRSSQIILQAAQALIRHNQQRVEKHLESKQDVGEKIVFCQEKDSEAEAMTVVDSLLKEKESFPYSQVAVFYRTNRQSRAIEDQLRYAQIPYCLYGYLKFYDRAEVKDLIAYFRLIVNPEDNVSLMRILNIPARGIGKKSMQKLKIYSREHSIGLFETMKVLVTEDKKLSTAVQKGFLCFLEIIRELQQEDRSSLFLDGISSLVKRINYDAYLKKHFPETYEDKLENIDELKSAIRLYHEKHPNATLQEWLQSVMLATKDQEEQVGVNLMTLHLAKGLEFQRVYIVGLEEGTLPHKNSYFDPKQLEEERRLLYVGITRASRKLSLLMANMRYVPNQDVFQVPSRFLNEIPTKYLQLSQGHPLTDDNTIVDDGEITYEPVIESEGFYFPDKQDAGQQVFHETYGRGIIRSSKDAIHPKLIVYFYEFGDRSIDPKYLRFSNEKA